MVETALSQPASIPVYSHSMRLVDHMSPAAAHSMGARFIRTRHRVIVRAVLPENIGKGAESPHLAHLSRTGTSYQQQLSTGHVWALLGIRGS